MAAACQQSPAAKPSETPVRPIGPTSSTRQIRATGKIRAVREYLVLTPKVIGQNPRLTLVSLLPTGASVRSGDVLAEFDTTQQNDAAREAEAKYEDLSHQVEQRQAENRSNAEKRAEERSQAQADLSKAQIQIRKGPILADIARAQAEINLEDASAHIASLKKSHFAQEVADAAALRILELKRDRQKVALDRARLNLQRLSLRAPFPGMIALENTWRSGSMGPPQEGDQMFPGQAILRIFDPSAMEVFAFVEEPDGAWLTPGVEASVLLDAYPDLAFSAKLVSASPVAAAALGSPIKRFAARFRMTKTDQRLLPDLAAAVVIQSSVAKIR